MKNISTYYFFIFTPLITIVLFLLDKLIGSYAFGSLLMIYALIYHSLISGLRLINSKMIERDQLWYNLIPEWNLKHFSFLFFDVKS